MEAEGAVTYKQKLEVLEQQQELIEDEQEQEQEAKEAEEEARREREEKEKADKLAKEAQKRDEFVSDVTTAVSVLGDCVCAGGVDVTSWASCLSFLGCKIL